MRSIFLLALLIPACSPNLYSAAAPWIQAAMPLATALTGGSGASAAPSAPSPTVQQNPGYEQMQADNARHDAERRERERREMAIEIQREVDERVALERARDAERGALEREREAARETAIAQAQQDALNRGPFPPSNAIEVQAQYVSKPGITGSSF